VPPVRFSNPTATDSLCRVVELLGNKCALSARTAVIDGEAVVARDDGVTEFHALRSALAAATVVVPCSCTPSTCSNSTARPAP